MAASSSNPPPQNAVVLIAEDEEIIRGNTAAFLKEAGFDVIETTSAVAALEIISEKKIDLVFTDIQMPGGMTGEALAEVLLIQYPAMPVILTSGATRPSIRNPRRRFVAKPYELREVENYIRELLH